MRDRLDPLDQFVDFHAWTVEFDDQQRLDIERIAGVNKGFGGVDRGLVHHLHAARNDACADDARHAFAGGLDFGEADHQRARRFRLLQDPHRDLGDDAEQAFGAGDDAHQIVARFSAALPPMRRISPDISTISQPSTLLVVMPYFRQCTPPEFSATLPPIEQAICDDGSGA